MSRFICFIASVFLLAAHAGAATVVHVANGDCAALSAAVAAATPDREATIILARGGHYSDCGILAHRGNSVIDGGGATLSTGICLSRVIDVDAGARVTLRNAVVSALDCGFAPPVGVIHNAGELALESVTVVADIRNEPGATMTLRNVSSQLYVTNSGTMNVFNSTLPNIVNNSQLTVANSVLASDGASASGCWITGVVHSLGGNVVGRSCTFAVASDVRLAAALDLGPLRDNGGLVPTYALASTSIARGKGVAQYCEATDARGLTRKPGRCDIGAYEFDANGQKVAVGGMNGTFYDRQANGHYITIQRLHDDTALVIWSTFDRYGNQAWIYGVGDAAGRHIHAEMSQNTGGRLQPGGAATGSSVHPWGTVDIDLTNCVSGTFSYRSSLPAFGSGEFPLDRLAFVSDVACVD